MIKRKMSFDFAIAILVFLLVFAFTWQLKGVKKNSEIRSRETLDRATLEKNYVDQVNKNEQLKNEIASQSEMIAAFRASAAEGDDYAAILNEKLSATEIFGGLVSVEGKGITVILDDVSPTQEMKDSGLYNNAGIVHDTNISTFINELKAAGAEAISVNDERVVAMTEVRCVGPTIMINGTRVSAPFTIKAIGNPETLESALKISGGAVETATKIYGISVTIQKSDKLYIKKYLGSTQSEYATMVKDEEGENE